ncbi:MAG: SGNH/GDSL hydrolase family protein [Armatimonadota bacterium]|nr:SGNH/GDSL hydrolase family protein [Armatimonadota bacterium]
MLNRVARTGLMVALALGVMGMNGVKVLADEPQVVREDIEWCDVWLPHSNEHALPRVLLIGDSITRAYYSQVETALKGKAYVARLATSKSVGDPALLGEVALVLDQCKFDVVHFNNGMHGWGYTEAEYQKAFPGFVEIIQKHAPGAKLIWATTTPVRVANNVNQVDGRTERVKARNAIAAEIVGKSALPIDDIFSLVENHPEYYSSDGVHSNEKGVEAEAAQVAATILKQL